MRKLLLPIALLALPTGASAQAATAPALSGPVIYEVRSWGRIVVRWQVNPDGTGEIWRGGERGSTELRKFRLRLDGPALKAFATNVEDVREATRDGIACKKEIHDLPYGSITWDYPGAKEAYAFDAGCRSDAADDVQDILTAASSNVEILAKIERTPYMIEPLPPR